MVAPRPLPRLTDDNRFFWTSGADGRLRLLRCQACEAFIHPPRPLCPHCRCEDVTPEAISGTGTIDTYTINHQKWRPDMEVPYVIARIRLDAAPDIILTSNVIGVAPSSVRIGDRVRVVFHREDDIFIPLFERLD